jgi:hypothetical protein
MEEIKVRAGGHWSSTTSGEPLWPPAFAPPAPTAVPIGEQRVLAVLSTTIVEHRRVRSLVFSRETWLVGAGT